MVAVGRGEEDYAKPPIMVKARELAETLKNSREFNSTEKRKQGIIIECNKVISAITGINYGATCKPRSSCCG